MTGSGQTTSAIIDKIIWQNKPFFDCVNELMIIADVDVFVDNAKNLELFVKGSRTNQNEAVIEDDGCTMDNFGDDSVDVRNKIIVYGEAGGLPVIHTSEDFTSQLSFGIKEEVIQDTSITDRLHAQFVGNTNKDRNKDPSKQGTSFMPFLSPFFNPGDMVYVVSQPQDLTETFRLVKYKFNVPDETMELTFSKTVGVPQLFKERIKKDISQEQLSNINRMKYSFNFIFDDFTNINQAASTAITVEDGKLRTTSGNSNGTMLSSTESTPVNVNSAEIRVVGDNLSGVTYDISADGTDNFQLNVSLNTPTSITNTGNNFRIRVNLTSADTRIDSLAVLYK